MELKLNNRSAYITIGIFVLYLLVGLSIYPNYGLSWDEPVQRSNVGKATYDYLVSGDTSLFSYNEKYYGSIYELVLYSMEKLLSIDNERSVFLFRHLFNFLLFFFATVVFYRMIRYMFNNHWIALMATLMLILYPRVFAHSFYNTKDLAFLSFMIFSLATLQQYSLRPNFKRILLHALTCAILVDTRLIGALVPFFTVILTLVNRTDRNLKWTLVFIVACTGFTFLFWPFLWNDPVNRLMEAVTVMSSFSFFESEVLFNGIYYMPEEVPWYYLQWWLMITIPIPFLILIIMGVVFTTRVFVIKGDLQMANNGLVPISFLIVLSVFMIVWVKKPILYDAWRHFLFLYPLMIIMAAYATHYFIENLKSSVVRLFLISLYLFGFTNSLAFIINNFPHEQVYFNRLAGKDMQQVKSKYELDYWGLSYLAGLKYIAKNDSSSVINIYGANEPCAYNFAMLSFEDKHRLRMVESLEDANYFLTNYRWHKEPYEHKNVYFEVKQGNASILTVFKKDEKGF